MSFPSSPFHRRSRARLLAALLTLGLPAFASAQDAPANAPKRELTDPVSNAVQNLMKLQTESNWDAMIAQIDQLLAKANPESFDTAYLSQLKVQALLNKQDYKNSIAPLETALALSEKYGFFGEKADLELLWLLSQLHAQEAAADKTPEGQRAKFAKAYTALRRWLDRTPKANPDAQYFAATILYNQALYDPTKIDKGLMEQARAEAEKGLRMSIKPKEQFYALLMAIVQQLGDYPKSAEYLELLVREYPKNKSYWQSLLNAYLMQEEKGFVRAIVTLERAQSQGLLTDPKENFTLVGLYLNTQQYSQAAELFEAGLRNGKLESDQKNWELLATAYQQLRKEDKAIATLKEAAKLFPKAGSLELQIGNLYYLKDKFEEALNHMKAAVSKGLEKSQEIQAQSYIAYLALDLKKLDEAKTAAERAVELNPESQESKRLLKAVNEEIELREAQKNATPASA